MNPTPQPPDTETLGIIKVISEVKDFKIQPVAPLEGKGGRLGFTQMLHTIRGYSALDGYKVETDRHTFHVLIDNGQSCCEDWGYLASEDDLSYFVGAELREVRLTDTALKQAVIEKVAPYGFDGGGIQFVDFVTSLGTFQLAVYNGHNGYYGHGILVAKDDAILLSETL